MPVTINGDGIVTAEGTSTTQGRLRLGEDTDNGTNYVELQAPASVASNVTFTLPSADGTNGQVLQTNGSGALSFANATSLASPLAVVGNSTAGAEIRLPEDTDNGSNYVALKAADNLASNLTFTLPSADGTSGQVLQTNASGTLSFANLAVANGGTGQTSLTANNVILGNGTSAVQFVDPGTNGNVLTSNGTTWTSAAASTGALVFLSSQTASNSATVDLETTFNSTYETYMVVASNIYVPTNNATLGVRLKISGSYQTASYKWHIIGPTSGATTYVGFNNSSDSAMTILPDIDAGTAFVNEFVFYINEPTNTSKYKMIWGLGISWDQGNSNLHNNHFAGAYFGGTGAMTGIRFLASSGNISSGTFRLYGIKKS